ncbi:tetratricopeptide repeat protein [Arthrobacter bambusae]|uniref:Tetratricopeptide (TPR) repeat protein n=1 Tax=Arthrobacter bambusae TaxID=1338426 RepID=A0AAW8DHR2_9MICC|nr:hypothetical protein [Arthrobacter bambusae]MDP9904709.1 tetratricopeptide (TPR) repeat protein [Arthrobacter bambusae]MDQ0129525.1 tetratricopeptide (TPR) repeat protein [Arthrobacter bambusae]MDQ0180862.1 tetratricopeptide (TPR) repeat protein [Arthrobacter bambusae]
MSDGIGAAAARADVLLEAGRSEEALSLARSAFSPDADHPGLRRVIGLALVELDRFEEAVDFTSGALARKPEDILNLELHREALRGSGDMAGAEAIARQALTLAPDALHLRLALASILLSKDRAGLLEAQALTESVLSVAPDNIDAIDSAARIHYNLGDLAAHGQMVQRGLQISPRNPELLLLAAIDTTADAKGRRGALKAVLSDQPMSRPARKEMATQLWTEWSRSARATWAAALLLVTTVPFHNALLAAGMVLVPATLVFRTVTWWRIRRFIPSAYAQRARKADVVASGALFASLFALVACYAAGSSISSSTFFPLTAGLGLLAALSASVAGARIPYAIARTAGLPVQASGMISMVRERKKWWWLLRAAQYGGILAWNLAGHPWSPSGGLFLMSVGVGWLAVFPWAVALVKETGWADRSTRSLVLWSGALALLDTTVGVFLVAAGGSKDA